MRLTYNHPKATAALPVFLDAQGKPLATADGVKALMDERNLTAKEVANICACSEATVYGWRQGRPPGAAPMLLLHRYLNGSLRFDGTDQ